MKTYLNGIEYGKEYLNGQEITSPKNEVVFKLQEEVD